MELAAEKYKQTAIGLIPSDWEVLPLGDLFEFKNGLNKEKKFFGVGTPIVNYMDVYKHNGLTANDISGKVTVTKQELRNYSVEKGDVFFTRTSETVEEIGIASTVLDSVKDTVFSGFVLRARPKNELLIDGFKKYCFSTENSRREITSKASYTTRALTNGRLLSQVRIPIPTKAEQTAIATALSDADSYISSLEKLIAKKRLIKQGAMQELLKPKEGWVVTTIGSICNIFGRIGFRGYTVNDIVEKGFGAITISPSNIQDDKMDFTSCTYISWFKYDESPEIKIYNGDILLVKTGSTFGKTALVSNLKEKATVNPQIVVLKNIVIDNRFLAYIMGFEIVQNKIKESVVGGAIPTLSQKQVANFEIYIPSAEAEQTKIADILSDMDAGIAHLEEKFEKTQRIKQGMMQQLLTGKIRLV